jgi:hypothetical protein
LVPRREEAEKPHGNGTLKKNAYWATGLNADGTTDSQAAKRIVTKVKMGAHLALYLAAALHHA